VAEAIAFAQRSGIVVTARSGGHDFAGRSSGPGIVLDLRAMRSLEVADGLAAVGPGFRLGDLYAALAQHEVTIPAGCGATVGIGGQALGGGLGMLGRRRGLTSDQVVAAQVVLADGRVVECEEQRHEGLFWALRGAGAYGLGVVTRLTLRTVPEPAATSFHLRWPCGRASALIAAWQEWSPTGPDALAASLIVTVGREAGAEPAVHLFGSMIGARPRRRRCSTSSCRSRAHPMKSEFFREPLPVGAIEALVELFVGGRRPGEARKLDFMPWEVPTTACLRTPPRSHTAKSCSCLSTPSLSRPASTKPRLRPRVPGCRTRGSSCTPPARAACTRTSPIWTCRMSTVLIGAATSSACGA
jgi:hypothetical protein